MGRGGGKHGDQRGGKVAQGDGGQEEERGAENDLLLVRTGTEKVIQRLEQAY